MSSRPPAGARRATAPPQAAGRSGTRHRVRVRVLSDGRSRRRRRRAPAADDEEHADFFTLIITTPGRAASFSKRSMAMFAVTMDGTIIFAAVHEPFQLGEGHLVARLDGELASVSSAAGAPPPTRVHREVMAEAEHHLPSTNPGCSGSIASSMSIKSPSSRASSANSSLAAFPRLAVFLRVELLARPRHEELELLASDVLADRRDRRGSSRRRRIRGVEREDHREPEVGARVADDVVLHRQRILTGTPPCGRTR